MARKPKDPRRLEAKKKRRLKRLQRKTEGGFFVSESDSFVPLGLEKMSEVLEQFVAPFIPETRDLDELRTLYSYGTMAWNLALLPESEQKEAIEDIVQKLGPTTAAVRDEVRSLLKELVLRKKTHFAGNRRMIAGFDLIPAENGYNLNVISSLQLPDRS